MPDHSELSPPAWPSRFSVSARGDELLFRDWLVPPLRRLPRGCFEGLQGPALALALVRRGLLPHATSAVLDEVRDRPQDASDGLFWQYPCRTEGAAWDVHHGMDASAIAGESELHLYVGLPWATWIDKDVKEAWTASGAAQRESQLRRLGARLHGWRALASAAGTALKVHTVCQHVAWRRGLPAWQALGITDLWLSHCPKGALDPAVDPSMQLRPWRLLAVNVEDAARSEGLSIGWDPEAKPWLASFVGAHAPYYPSDVRLRLAALANEPGFFVRLSTEWHFEREVYGAQVHGRLSPERADSERVTLYNQTLCGARFALCPSGTGPNTLRLWEALAVGSVPVLLGEQPELPRGGSLPDIDWDSIVLRCGDDALPKLPERLHSLPVDEVRRRSAAGRAAFEQVRRQTCF